MPADPEVARYQSWQDFTEADGRDFIEDSAGCQLGDPGWFQFALADRRSGVFVGDCGLNISKHDRRLATIGYTISRPHWNRGLGSEAVSALAAYAFTNFALHRIAASVDPRNAASCRVLGRRASPGEAHFRQSEWFKGEWTDDVIYGRLASDR